MRRRPTLVPTTPVPNVPMHELLPPVPAELCRACKRSAVDHKPSGHRFLPSVPEPLSINVDPARVTERIPTCK